MALLDIVYGILPSFVITLVVIYVVEFLIRTIWQWPGRPGRNLIRSGVTVPIYAHPDICVVDKIINYAFPIFLKLGSLVDADPETIESVRSALIKMDGFDEKKLQDIQYKLEMMTIDSENKDVSGGVDVAMFVPEEIIIESSSSSDDNKTKSNNNLVIWIHGGGLVLGTCQDGLLTNAVLPMLLDGGENKTKKCRPVICSVDHRLIPEHVFPAASDDIVTVLKYVCSNKEMQTKYKYDNVIVSGISAGGYLAVVSAKTFIEQNPALRQKIVGIVGIDSMMIIKPNHQSRYRNAWTRSCPVQFIDWCWKVYRGKEEEDTVMLGCLDQESWKKLEWKKGSVLLTNGKADPMYDGQMELVTAIREGLGQDRVIDFVTKSSHAFGILDKSTYQKFIDQFAEMILQV